MFIFGDSTDEKIECRLAVLEKTISILLKDNHELKNQVRKLEEDGYIFVTKINGSAFFDSTKISAIDAIRLIASHLALKFEMTPATEKKTVLVKIGDE